MGVSLGQASNRLVGNSNIEGGCNVTRLTTDEQLEEIWNLVIEAGIAPIRTVDRWDDAFTIFEGWNHVEEVARLIYGNFVVLTTEHAPTWVHLPQDRQPDPYHHIEWAIGEFGFTDQYSTCSHCYVAIDETAYHEDHWRNSATGEVTCGDCLRNEPSWGDDYLTDMAAQLCEDGNGIIVRMANPSAPAHNFVCINGESSRGWGYYYDNDSDHPDYDSRLTYADRERLQRLGKAAQIIDPRLQIVYAYSGGSNRIWARFNPNDNVEYSFYGDNSGWDTQDGDMGNMVLGYAIGRVIAKWVKLQDKVGWK